MGAATTAVIRQAVRQRLGMLHELTGLPAVFGGAVEDDEGHPVVVISQVYGLRTPALEGLVVHPGTGLGGKALAPNCVVGVLTGYCATAFSDEAARQMATLAPRLAPVLAMASDVDDTAPAPRAWHARRPRRPARRRQPLSSGQTRTCQHRGNRLADDVDQMVDVGVAGHERRRDADAVERHAGVEAARQHRVGELRR